MSYYGVRKLKLVKTEDNKYNYSCEYYDSSLRDFNGNRIWNKVDKLYGKSFENKEDLEYLMFQDVLDGNIHISGSKFGCLTWGNRKTKLTEAQSEILQLLYKEDRERYEELRYDYHFLAWKNYLAEQQAKNKENRNKPYCIVKCDVNGYDNVYIKTLGNSHVSFTYYKNQAKKIKKSLDEIKEILSTFTGKYSNIQLIEV